FGELTTYGAAFSGSNVYGAQYTRDSLGRITGKTETISGVTDSFDYIYDLAGRLTGVSRNAATTAIYTYDDNGNRITGPDGTTSYSYDDQDRLLTQGSTLDTRAFAYTANGELATKTH